MRPDDATDEEIQQQIAEMEEERERKEKERDELQRLRTDALAARFQEWFLENFEPPAAGSSYEEYIWGGPYEARPVLRTFFPEYAREDRDEDEAMGIAVRELERKSASWVPTGSRLEPPPPLQAPRSAQEAYERLQKNVQALKDLLSRIPEQPAGMGHNYPPEPLDDYPLTADDQKELTVAISIVENQTIQPPDKGEEAKVAAIVIETKAQKIKSWLARQGDNFVTEAIKETGKEFGKWMPRAFWLFLIERMLGVTDTITAWLKLVFPHF